jgi:hypothetical protein
MSPEGNDMAARKLHKMHSDEIRQKIQASLLVNRLHGCAMGEIELTPTQVNAINSLLDRSVPKLSQIQHTGDDRAPIIHKVVREIVRA